MELEHLRQHALELHGRLERAETELENRDHVAEFWQDEAMRLREAASDPEFATHRSIGITKEGELLVVRVDA